MKFNIYHFSRTAPYPVRQRACLLNMVLVVCLFLLAFASQGAYSRIIYVKNTNDTEQVNSLRGAIMEANKSPQPITIVLSADEYDLGTNDQIDVSGNVEVVGKSAGSTIAATDYGARIFLVKRGAVLTLVNVILTGGAAQQGAAICNGGVLNMRDCTIAENASVPVFTIVNPLDPAHGGDGGGIYNSNVATLDNCTLCGNQGGAGDSDPLGFGGSGGNGGGIFNSGVMTLNWCTLMKNYAGEGGQGSTPEGIIVAGFPNSPSGPGGNGGGIYNSGKLNLNYCIVFANTAGDGGPGIQGGAAGNGGDGGGIYNSGKLFLKECLIVENSAGNGGGATPDFWYPNTPYPGGSGGSGGGILNKKGASLSLAESQILFNYPGGSGADTSGITGEYPDTN